MLDGTKRVVLGTAGHVDHGKTTLIKALTGVDTDRLPEEKARGISIELGFAEFRLPSGRTAAVVDVPGHERFIKNMLAGATGIDLVLLVVAADEGVMPQTREHLDIVSLLGVKKGIKVITKVDMVDEDWLELVKDDVETLARGSFLERAPLVVCSGVTGRGLDSLKKVVDEVLDEVPQRDATALPRLPVDRAFSIVGYGTVVTGTLVAGSLRVFDRVEILPRRLEARIRNIQVHGRQVESALAGQRVAINLAGIDRDEVPRGSVLTTGGWLQPSVQFAARLEITSRAEQPLKNLARVHIHYGTAEAIARVVLLERDELLPGESAPARIRAEEPVVVARGDRFIIRSYSPVTTIGGGVVVSAPSSHKRKSQADLADFLAREKGDPAQDIRLLLQKPPYLLSAAEIARKTGMTDEATSQILSALVNSGDLSALGGGYVLKTVVSSVLERVVGYVHDELLKRPLLVSVQKEEVRRKTAPEIDSRLFGLLLQEAVRTGMVSVDGTRVQVAPLERSMPPRLQSAVQSVVLRLGQQPFAPPPPEDLTKGLGLTREEEADLIAHISETGIAIRISEQMIMQRDAFEEAKARLLAKINESGSITVSEFRDMLGTSRRYALPILEYFDQQKLTRRKGDERVPFFSRQA